MSNYNKATNFSVKDTLTSGDPDKVVSGAEIDNELDAISSAVGSKADKVTAATTDNIATLDANGNLKDGGVNVVSVAPPVGSVIMHASSTAPSGWLECDGSTVNRSTYPDLFNAIGSTFGAGDGSTTFGLPDLRGEFVRGWDDGRGVDNGRELGTSQLDQMQSHDHYSGMASNNDTSARGLIGEQRYGTADTGHSSRGFSDGGSVKVGQFSSGGGNREGITSTARSGREGAETRPRNIALMYIIKT